MSEATRTALAPVLVVALAASASAANRCPDEGCVRVRAQDRVVLISSRPIGCSTSPEKLDAGLYAMEYADVDGDDQREWREAPWRSVIEGDRATPMIVYAHGNRVSWRETRRRGLYVYKRLLRCARDERPIHYLIWSWCSDQLERPILDYRTKAARTGPVGKQLGWVICQMRPDLRLGFMGYSYGARVTSGALHEVGSGCCEGPPRWVRAFYVAAAFDSHWLGRGRCHGAAMDVTEKLLMTADCKDPAMRFYRFLPRGYDPQAMGYAGPACLDRERASRVRLVNVTGCVGSSHDLCDYVNAPGLMQKAFRLLSYADEGVEVGMR